MALRPCFRLGDVLARRYASALGDKVVEEVAPSFVAFGMSLEELGGGGRQAGEWPPNHRLISERGSPRGLDIEHLLMEESDGSGIHTGSDPSAAFASDELVIAPPDFSATRAGPEGRPCGLARGVGDYIEGARAPAGEGGPEEWRQRLSARPWRGRPPTCGHDA